MAETKRGSDLGTGVGMLFGLVAVVAAIATAATAFLSETQGSDTMQLLSGIALAVALLAGGVAVVAIQVFD